MRGSPALSLSWGLCPQTPGSYRVPDHRSGVGFHALQYPPLRLLPRRAASSKAIRLLPTPDRIVTPPPLPLTGGPQGDKSRGLGRSPSSQPSAQIVIPPPKLRHPLRRQVHVNQDSQAHDLTSGSSRSSIRHAAYARTASMSSGSRYGYAWRIRSRDARWPEAQGRSPP